MESNEINLTSQKITEKQAKETLNSHINAPWGAYNIRWSIIGDDNPIIQLDFKYEGADYICKLQHDEGKKKDSNANSPKNDSFWKDAEEFPLEYWGDGTITAKMCASTEKDNSRIINAKWYDSRDKVAYYCSSKNNDMDLESFKSVIHNMYNFTENKRSNRRNIELMALGLLSIACFISHAYYAYSLYSIDFLILLFGFIFAAIGWSNFSQIRTKNAQLETLPFKFNFDSEYDSYANIGSKKKNRKANSIPHPEKYTKWKTSVKKRFGFLNHVSNKEDFYKLLKNQHDYYNSYIDIIKSALIPIELSIITILTNDLEIIINTTPNGIIKIQVQNGSILIGLISNLILLFIIVHEIAKSESQRDFLKDFSDTLFSETSTIDVDDNTENPT